MVWLLSFALSATSDGKPHITAVIPLVVVYCKHVDFVVLGAAVKRYAAHQQHRTRTTGQLLKTVSDLDSSRDESKAIWRALAIPRLLTVDGFRPGFIER